MRRFLAPAFALALLGVAAALVAFGSGRSTPPARAASLAALKPITK
jgi:hypothetical protein